MIDAVRTRGVWVLRQPRHLGGRLDVLVELIDGTYRIVYSEDASHDHEGPTSHYVHAGSFGDRPVHELTEA